MTAYYGKMHFVMLLAINKTEKQKYTVVSGHPDLARPSPA